MGEALLPFQAQLGLRLRMAGTLRWRVQQEQQAGTAARRWELASLPPLLGPHLQRRGWLAGLLCLRCHLPLLRGVAATVAALLLGRQQHKVMHNCTTVGARRGVALAPGPLQQPAALMRLALGLWRWI